MSVSTINMAFVMGMHIGQKLADWRAIATFGG